MLCPRCGATFEGNFCPRCGTPAVREAAGPAAGRACVRCGMVFQGNFCPRCGLPVAMAAYPVAMARPASGAHSPLSILWLVSVIGFVLLIAMNFAGLLVSPAYVAPGIQGIASGQDTNQAFDTGTAGWSFQALNGSATTGTFVSGGPSGGFVQMSVPAGNGRGGEWVQAIQLHGSAPYVAAVRLDLEVVAGGSLTGVVLAALEPTPTGIDLQDASVVAWTNQSVAWTTPPAVDVSAALGDAGTYYLKVAFLALSGSGSTTVSFDNVQMKWTTDAVFYFYLPLPLPVLLYISQDPGQFLAYYAFIVLALVGSGLWYTWRDRKTTVRAFTAPLDAIGARLRSMSAWVAVAQVWLAGTFFQSAVIFILGAIGAPVTSPINPTATSAWTLVFQLATASVFEEITFRMFLVGLPMTIAVLLLRATRGSRGGPEAPPRSQKSGVALVLGQLWGGQLRRESPREERLVGGILVLLSALLWALAHVEGGGWGWWKAVPVFVMGLGAGYIFLRHGLGASILLHFATDGLLLLSLEGVGGVGVDVVTTLLFLGLSLAGSGFFAWYVIYGWEEFQDLRRAYGAHVVRQPTPAGPAAPPPGWSYAPPPTWTPVPPPAYGAPPPTNPPPPPSGYTPPPGYAPPPQWTPAPAAMPPRSALQIPPGYAPTYHPPPYGYPPVRFQCPYCGWVEARYEGRHFTCLRCGRTA